MACIFSLQTLGVYVMLVCRWAATGHCNVPPGNFGKTWWIIAIYHRWTERKGSGWFHLVERNLFWWQRNNRELGLGKELLPVIVICFLLHSEQEWHPGSLRCYRGWEIPWVSCEKTHLSNNVKPIENLESELKTFFSLLICFFLLRGKSPLELNFLSLWLKLLIQIKECIIETCIIH